MADKKGNKKGESQGKLSSRDRANVLMTLTVNAARIVHAAIYMGGIVGCLYICRLGLRDIAGTKTEAHVLVELVAHVGFSRWAAWVLAALSMGYGVRQRKLRDRVF